MSFTPGSGVLVADQKVKHVDGMIVLRAADWVNPARLGSGITVENDSTISNANNGLCLCDTQVASNVVDALETTVRIKASDIGAVLGHWYTPVVSYRVEGSSDPRGIVSGRQLETSFTGAPRIHYRYTWASADDTQAPTRPLVTEPVLTWGLGFWSFGILGTDESEFFTNMNWGGAFIPLNPDDYFVLSLFSQNNVSGAKVKIDAIYFEHAAHGAALAETENSHLINAYTSYLTAGQWVPDPRPRSTLFSTNFFPLNFLYDSSASGVDGHAGVNNSTTILPLADKQAAADYSAAAVTEASQDNIFGDGLMNYAGEITRWWMTYHLHADDADVSSMTHEFLSVIVESNRYDFTLPIDRNWHFLDIGVGDVFTTNANATTQYAVWKPLSAPASQWFAADRYHWCKLDTKKSIFWFYKNNAWHNAIADPAYDLWLFHNGSWHRTQYGLQGYLNGTWQQ